MTSLKRKDVWGQALLGLFLAPNNESEDDLNSWGLPLDVEHL